MRHQERNVSEFDEIITYPPSAAPSGEKQVMSCVQAFTAALGFAMSAGWDWLPSMHKIVASRLHRGGQYADAVRFFRHAVGKYFL